MQEKLENTISPVVALPIIEKYLIPTPTQKGISSYLKFWIKTGTCPFNGTKQSLPIFIRYGMVPRLFSFSFPRGKFFFPFFVIFYKLTPSNYWQNYRYKVLKTSVYILT